MSRSPGLTLIDELLAPLSESNDVQVWRGQASNQWPLQPGLYRRIAKFSDNASARIDETAVLAYELDLLAEANGLGYYDSNRVKTMVRLQHHGAATRLLDVSRNPFVALWFATDEGPAGADGVVFHFAISPDRDYHYYDSSSWDSITSNDHAGKPILYFPDAVDGRVRAQQSGFLTTVLASHREFSDDFLSAGPQLGITKAVIPAELKPELRQYLQVAQGMSAYTIYPDFQGYALAHSATAPFPRSFAELHDGRNGLFPNQKR